MREEGEDYIEVTNFMAVSSFCKLCYIVVYMR